MRVVVVLRIRLVYSGLRIRLAVGLSVTENESGGSLENQVGSCPVGGDLSVTKCLVTLSYFFFTGTVSCLFTDPERFTNHLLSKGGNIIGKNYLLLLLLLLFSSLVDYMMCRYRM